MIRLGILDISEHPESELYCLASRLSHSFGMREKKNKKANVQSIFARLLLTKLYKTYKNTSLPQIVNDGKGKPCFAYDVRKNGENCYKKSPLSRLEEKQILFNISHDENLIAVAVSDEGEVGIDIQSHPAVLREKARIEEAVSAFLMPCNVRACEISDTAELVVYGIDIKSGRLFKKPSAFLTAEKIYKNSEAPALTLPSEEEADFLLSWTRLESLLKLSGGGFSDTAIVGEIASGAKVGSLFVTDTNGRIYSLSLATPV